MKGLILPKVITVKNVWFISIGFFNHGFKFQDLKMSCYYVFIFVLRERDRDRDRDRDRERDTERDYIKIA